MTNFSRRQILLVAAAGHVAFDQDAKLAETTRRKMFDEVVAAKSICTGYHWGMPGAGTIAKDGNGYALVPVA